MQPVLIDEIQYAPELLPHIKMAVDADGEPGRFWLTGSQQFHLMRDVSESLAGRAPSSGLDQEVGRAGPQDRAGVLCPGQVGS